jgi:diguanylate cyclase (GGDEF)-like protein/PAS domain S-box-containing protein
MNSQAVTAPNDERPPPSRATLERWFKTTPAILHSIDSSGRIIAVSDAWLAKFGYGREEVLGRKSLDFLTPESRAYALGEVVSEFYRTGRRENVEYQMVCKDGRVLDVLLSAVLDPGDAEHGACSLAVITDVTEFRIAQRKLVESQALYQGIVDDQTDLVSLLKPDGELCFVNEAYTRVFGRQPHELIGASALDNVPAGARASVVEQIKRVCATREPVESENQIVTADGQTRWIAWTNKAIVSADGRVTAIHCVGRDVERRVVAEQRLKASEARYRMLADNSSDIVFQVDRGLVRQYVSPASRDILGYDPSELIGVKPVEQCHPDDAHLIAEAASALLAGEAERRTVVNRSLHRDGHWVWVEAELKALRDPATGEVTGIIGALRDISKRKAIEEQLAEATRRLEILAAEDGLTGLANRRSFDDTFDMEYRRAQREGESLALIMIDVDRFKDFNDYYGHPAGDACLKQVADKIGSAILRPGDFAARYGGEEFAVLLPNTHLAGALEVAERIRLAVRELRLPNAQGVDGVVTISAGVVASSNGARGEGTDQLLKKADRALYQAKNAGRDFVFNASWLPGGGSESESGRREVA